MTERAFLYGDLLIESMRLENGMLLYGDRHFARLASSAAVLKFALPGSFTESFFTDEILKAAASEKLDTARVRFVLFRDSEGYYTPVQHKVGWEITLEALPASRREVKSLGVFAELRKPCNVLSNLKSGNALVYVMAGIFAKEKNWDDCLVLNERGNVAEAVSSNLFVVKGEVLYTPGLEEGCVNGVMRGLVIDRAREAGYRVIETAIDLSFPGEADEIFLTNAVSGIVAVSLYDGMNLESNIGARLRQLIGC